jgi:poly(3-hydroxybutyrate) depolymerase
MKQTWLAVLTILAALCPGAAGARARPGTPIADGLLVKYEAKDRLGRTITYYASRPETPRPLMLMIQGSGCETLLHGEGRGTYSTMFDLLPFAREKQFTVLAVEKPFSEAAPGGRPGGADGCSTRFNADFTAETWLAGIETAVGEARRLPFVDRRRMLVLGMSEGAVMASLLAGRNRYVTDVVAIGGSGTTQLYDFSRPRTGTVPTCRPARRRSRRRRARSRRRRTAPPSSPGGIPTSAGRPSSGRIRPGRCCGAEPVSISPSAPWTAAYRPCRRS